MRQLTQDVDVMGKGGEWECTPESDILMVEPRGSLSLSALYFELLSTRFSLAQPYFVR